MANRWTLKEQNMLVATVLAQREILGVIEATKVAARQLDRPETSCLQMYYKVAGGNRQTRNKLPANFKPVKRSKPTFECKVVKQRSGKLKIILTEI